MTRILFSSPCQPYPTHFNNASLTEASTPQRFTQQQDLFMLSGYIHCQGIHLIARNISAPGLLDRALGQQEDFGAASAVRVKLM